jgi:hypothetical protein
MLRSDLMEIVQLVRKQRDGGYTTESDAVTALELLGRLAQLIADDCDPRPSARELEATCSKLLAEIRTLEADIQALKGKNGRLADKLAEYTDINELD